MALVNPTSGAGPCDVMDILANDYFQIIKSVNRKFNALRRLAELIEQLGDLSGFIPDLSKLIPIKNIDLSTYANLKAACPQLDLPDLGIPDVTALQAEVNAAYGRLRDKLLKHPWMRLDALQEEMTNYQSQFNAFANKGTSFMQCLQAGCAAYQAGSQFFSGLGKLDIEKELTTLFKNTVNGQVKVLNTQMEVKKSQVNDARDQLTVLSQMPGDNTSP